MKIFELTNGEDRFIYKYPESPSEITLGKVIDYEQQITPKKPESLQKLEELTDEEEREEYLSGLDPVTLERDTISFYMREVGFFTGMKEEHLRLIPTRDPEGFDIFSLRNLIRSAFIGQKAELINSFRFLGSTYLLPDSPPNLFNQQELDFMRGAKIGEYCTASELYRAAQMMKKGSAEGLLFIIATLCRKKGESLPIYPDEQTKFIRERAELFKNLDYQTALNVGFFLTKRDENSPSVFRSLLLIRAARRALSRKNTAFI